MPDTSSKKSVVENECPNCGRIVRLHGGMGWRGSGTTCESDDGSYRREFGGWALIEEYRCPSCGTRWEVQRVEDDSFPADPGSYRSISKGQDGYCPYCGTQEQDDTDWGEETITSRGDKVKVFMSCRRCRHWWYGMYVLGEPQVLVHY